ncbi:hypothetical protein CNECB9_2370160 [Cupriavidus necator]|uniref:Uncharacterized protein n=1 Tax=Cupriavidus necator TaxID=106590 RepID=A0A1K0IE29_CUPNE|nr:hypothetical protein CNECB9_2370160 [Cupriavidus necator]
MTTDSKDAAPRAMGVSAVTDEQIRDIAARFQSRSDSAETTGFISFYSTNLERFARALLAQPEPSREVERDAARYRAWRTATCSENEVFLNAATDHVIAANGGDSIKAPTPEQIDEAIDAAMSTSKEGA